MKKRILIHSNFCKAFTGFGKNKKNIMRYLYDTNKYEIFELADAYNWDSPNLKSVPWECRGSLPRKKDLVGLDASKRRSEGYGFTLVDKAVKEFKPDVYIGMEDIWAYNGFHNKPWWNKINCMVWTTLDSLPILPQAIEYAPKIKNYYVWSSFAEKAMKEAGYNHVETLRGSIDTDNFFRHSDENRKKLRDFHNLEDEFIIGFVFRNQLRKSVPNLLDGFKLFKDRNPHSNAKLLLHTNWKEAWDIERFIEEKKINNDDILTTYICEKCNSYHILNYEGEKKNCPTCHSKKTLSTVSTTKGVNEEQLNEIYNLMDVYCHPFTSGGQEIPIQEAKLTELITLVTDYSCGEDNCTEESGGIPLKWSEYREPGTQFIKAATCPKSICEGLETVHNLPPVIQDEMGKQSRKWVIDNFSIDVVGRQLEQILDAMPEVNYDFESNSRDFNHEYNPENGMTAPELIIDIYKNILDEDVDKNSTGFKHWMKKLSEGEKPVNIINHFKSIAAKQSQKKPLLEELLDDTGRKRVAIILPEGKTDVLFINSLLEDFQSKNKDCDIYFFTKPEFYEYIEDNPFVYKLLPYEESLNNTFDLEGIGANKGIFDMAFYPNTTTQKYPCYIHNGYSNNI